jgi:murein DD-endopeptidase MepM/ murein hydrolase activator NlpD
MRRLDKVSALLFTALGLGGCSAAPSEEGAVGTVQQALTTVLLEAEAANYSNSVIENEHAGFTGSGYVNNDNAVGSWVEWSVNAPAAGSAVLRFRFANGASARPASLTVNGQVVDSNFNFPDTDAWTNWSTAATVVNLVAGNNSIRLTATTSSGGPNYDSLEAELPDEPAPAGLVWPLSGQQGQDWVVNRYVDLDPGPGFADYLGGTVLGIDGHYALDIDIPSFRQMDDGSAQVLAIAPGTVGPTVDGQFDRHTNLDPGAIANQVIVYHDNGIQAQYLHLKQNSLAVSEGDRVEAGDLLGIVGSSGYSTQPHLHLDLFDVYGAPISAFQQGLWEAPPSYEVSAQLMDGILIREGDFNDDNIKDPAPNITQIQRDRMLGFGAHVAGGDPGQNLTMLLRRPDGSLAAQLVSQFLNDGHTYWHQNTWIPIDAPLGTWRIDVTLAGQSQGSWFVDVIDSSGPVTTTYQAEDGSWNNATVDNNHSGYTGSGFVNTANTTGTWVELTVTASGPGTAQVSVRYANGGSSRPTQISVNGMVVEPNFVFGGTGAWNSWQTASFNAPVNAGNNVIRITGTSSASCPNFDSLDVTL